MKKAIFVNLFILLAFVVYGQIPNILQEMADQVIDVRTSNGIYWVTYFYDGKNQGQTRANWMVADPRVGGGERTWTPESAHLECRDYIVNKLKPTRGDTYVITIMRPGSSRDNVKFTFVIEFISSTQYNWWFSRG